MIPTFSVSRTVFFFWYTFFECVRVIIKFCMVTFVSTFASSLYSHTLKKRVSYANIWSQPGALYNIGYDPLMTWYKYWSLEGYLHLSEVWSNDKTRIVVTQKINTWLLQS